MIKSKEFVILKKEEYNSNQNTIFRENSKENINWFKYKSEDNIEIKIENFSENLKLEVKKDFKIWEPNHEIPSLISNKIVSSSLKESSNFKKDNKMFSKRERNEIISPQSSSQKETLCYLERYINSFGSNKYENEINNSLHSQASNISFSYILKPFPISPFSKGNFPSEKEEKVKNNTQRHEIVEELRQSHPNLKILPIKEIAVGKAIRNKYILTEQNDKALYVKICETYGKKYVSEAFNISEKKLSNWILTSNHIPKKRGRKPKFQKFESSVLDFYQQNQNLSKKKFIENVVNTIKCDQFSLTLYSITKIIKKNKLKFSNSKNCRKNIQ